jgi:hypothetical protein
VVHSNSRHLVLPRNIRLGKKASLKNRSDMEMIEKVFIRLAQSSIKLQ